MSERNELEGACIEHILATAVRSGCLTLLAGRCIGGGIDLITACDLRICSQDATFCVKVGIKG